jgi:hypothetical protein
MTLKDHIEEQILAMVEGPEIDALMATEVMW